MKVDPFLPTYHNKRRMARSGKPGKGFPVVGGNQFERAKRRAEIRLEGIRRQKMARSDQSLTTK